MRKSRFTEAQIIGMIKEQEAGMPTAEVCRRHGLSPATFYKLKSKYGGMEVSEAASGPVAFLCRPTCSFRPLSFRKRPGFSNPVLSAAFADCRSR